MDSNVKALMDATKCTETEAQSVLEASGGNLSKAMKMLDAGSKEIMVFNVAFTVQGKEETGYLVAMFDIASHSVTLADLAYPLDKALAGMLDIAMPPTVFASTIATARGKLNDRNQSASRSNAQHIKSKLTSSFAQAVVGMANKGQREQINEKFAKVIGEVIGETVNVRSFSRAHSLDSISGILGQHAHSSHSSHSSHETPAAKAAQLFSDGAEAAPELNASDIPNASPQEALPRIVLICEPEISPFDGKPARELVEGDQVVVKIKDGRDSARYFAELLGGCVGDELLPVCAPIVKTGQITDVFVETYVEFGPGIFGQYFIPPNVRLRTADEDMNLYDPFQNDETLFSDNRMGRKILMQMGLLVVSAAALIVLFWQIGM